MQKLTTSGFSRFSPPPANEPLTFLFDRLDSLTSSYRHGLAELEKRCITSTDSTRPTDNVTTMLTDRDRRHLKLTIGFQMFEFKQVKLPNLMRQSLTRVWKHFDFANCLQKRHQSLKNRRWSVGSRCRDWISFSWNNAVSKWTLFTELNDNVHVSIELPHHTSQQIVQTTCRYFIRDATSRF